MSHIPKYLSVAKSAKHFGIGQNRIRSYVNAGELKAVRFPEDKRRPRAMWIEVADLERLLNSLAA